MEEMEEKLEAILNNPQMMQQIMTMAQALGQNQPPQPPVKQEAAPLPNIDLGMIQKLSGFARQSNINNDEQALLNALNPYISSDRIHKLERAMRAAKMAKFASAFLNAGGLQMLTGR